MVFCTLHTIKARTKIQVDTYILLFFCYLFGVGALKFISIVILKEIVFTCLIYAATV